MRTVCDHPLLPMLVRPFKFFSTQDRLSFIVCACDLRHEILSLLITFDLFHCRCGG